MCPSASGISPTADIVVRLFCFSGIMSWPIASNVPCCWKTSDLVILTVRLSSPSLRGVEESGRACPKRSEGTACRSLSIRKARDGAFSAACYGAMPHSCIARQMPSCCVLDTLYYEWIRGTQQGFHCIEVQVLVVNRQRKA